MINGLASLEARNALPVHFLHFTYLQILDVLTTLAFLTQGIGEANPVVRLFIQVAPNPFLGLAAVKCAAVLLAIYCWRAGRSKLLFKANVFFALLVVWNLSALVLRGVH